MGPAQFDFGAFGVGMFFVITGFFASESCNRPLKSYVINKLIRLYPVYIAGFTVSFLFIYICCRMKGISLPYGIKDYLIQISLQRDWLWIPSIDGLSHTLESQFKFYAVIYLMVCLGAVKYLSRFILSCILLLSAGLAGGALWSQGVSHTTAFVITFSAIRILFMLCGTCLANYHFGVWNARESVLGLAVAYCFFITVAHISGIHNEAAPVSSYSLALLMFIVAYFYRDVLKPDKVIEFLSTISYPFYAVHGIAGYFIMSVFDFNGFNPIVCLLAASTSALLLASLLHVLVEEPCLKISHKYFQRQAKTLNVNK